MRHRRTLRVRNAIGLGIVAALVAATPVAAYVEETADQHSPEWSAEQVSGRTACPGATWVAMTNLEGSPADRIEAVQLEFDGGSANPATGVMYCQYGATTLRVCYAYSSLNQQFCDASGCTNQLAYQSAPQGPSCSMGTGGDSGGGVFREVTGGVSARGIVVARGGNAQSCFAWDHKRQTILNLYDATVVTD